VRQNAKLSPAVSESTQVSETITKVVADFGKIDVFVANAGWFPTATLMYGS
jgi:NAD(P)-dependent dehydrogenase (short-subunit alcohol dehydrogenase family)